jgi:hypothetical protein
MNKIAALVLAMVALSAVRLAFFPSPSTELASAVSAPGLRQRSGFLLSAPNLQVSADTPFPLEMTLPAKGYVYLFDVSDDSANLIWNHEGDAWEPGKYRADEIVLYAPGDHRLLAVFSERPVTGVTAWHSVQPHVLAEICPGCSLATVDVVASAKVDSALKPLP